MNEPPKLEQPPTLKQITVIDKKKSATVVEVENILTYNEGHELAIKERKVMITWVNKRPDRRFFDLFVNSRFVQNYDNTGCCSHLHGKYSYFILSVPSSDGSLRRVKTFDYIPTIKEVEQHLQNQRMQQTYKTLRKESSISYPTSQIRSFRNSGNC